MKVWNQYFIAPAVIKDACYIIFLHNKDWLFNWNASCRLQVPINDPLSDSNEPQ
ncbi:hypothetical protein JHK82_053119 [Glycine max]|nr:hypothetical protein JHK85_053823 [Glycine max]KAG5085722.1 hypothetical protein JHK82_053119 [Glycine max]